MNLTDQLDESFIYFFCILFAILVIILSWLSTNVREFVLPGNLLLIERRSRRLYTAYLNGNLNRIISPPQLSSTLSANRRQVTTSTTNRTNSETIASTNYTEPYLNSNVNRNSQIDLVDEMVEQALVDNLLDGNYYNTGPIQDSVNNRNTINNQSNSTDPISQITNENEPTVLSSSNEDDESNLVNNSNEPDDSSGLLINILIKFVNEKEMKIQARPSDTILLLKRTHFATELNSNKIVRFIYQGQFLCDKNTIKSYNIKDQTTIHCHITSKQPTISSNNTTSNELTTNNLRQRINSHQINSITRITGGISHFSNESANLNGANSNATNSLPENTINSVNTNNDSSSTITNTTTTINNTSSETIINQNTINNGNSIRVPLTRRNRRVNNHQHHVINTATIINVDLTNIFLPFFAVLLGSFWYIRVHFKHFFTPFSTLVLFLISFIYALFLFNNIYTSSFVEANNQLILSRIFNRRSSSRNQQQEQLQQNQTQQAQTVQN